MSRGNTSLLKSYNNDTNPVYDKNVNNPTETFIVVIIICLALFVITVLLFSWLRTKLKRVYAPKLILMPDKLFPHGKLPSSLFAWVSPAFMISDDDIFNHLGLDALVYLRFLRLLLKAAIFTFPYGIFILVPLNVHGGNNVLEGLDMISMSNVKRSSPKLWAHVIAVWIYSLTLLYMINEEWQIFVLYRQTYMTKKLGKEYTLLVQDIPKENQDERIFMDYVKNLFPDQVFSTHIVKDLTVWQSLINKHDKLVRKLERIKASDSNSGGGVGSTSHLISMNDSKAAEIERELGECQVLLREEQHAGHTILPSAFVFFKTPFSKTAASQTVWDFQAGTYKVTSAPDASEVLWGNLALPAWKRSLRRNLAALIVVALVILWAIPITFVASLTKLKSLAKKLTFLKGIADDNSSILHGVIQGIIPVVLIVLFNAVLPYILERLGKFSGLVSKAKTQLYVFSHLTLFLVCNTFLFFILAGSFFSNIQQIMNNPKDIPTELARTLPSQANYYLNYVCLMAFVGNGVEITRLFWLIYIEFRFACCATTSRERLETWRPSDPPYATLFATDVLIFLIALTFSVLSPVVIPLVILYFAFRYIIWVYQLLHVYMQELDLGGLLWPRVSSSMVVGMVIFQLLMIGVFTLKKAFVIVGILSPLPFITFAVWKFTYSRYERVSKHLSLREGRNMRNADIHFLQNVASSYVRNYQCPGLYEVSKRIEMEELDGTGYTSIDEETQKESKDVDHEDFR